MKILGYSIGKELTDKEFWDKYKYFLIPIVVSSIIFIVFKIIDTIQTTRAFDIAVNNCISQFGRFACLGVW